MSKEEYFYKLYKVSYVKNNIPHYAYFTEIKDATEFAKQKQGKRFYRLFSTNEWREFYTPYD